MSSFPYLPLYVDDYDASTAHLSIEEDGAYLRLLRLCWRTPGCSIPADPAWIMRRLRVDQATYDRVIAPVIAEFFKLARGRLFQKRLREEFDRVNGVSKARKDAGKRGGVAKALKNKDKEASKATDLPEQTASKSLASRTRTRTRTIEEKKDSPTDLSAGEPPDPNPSSLPADRAPALDDAGQAFGMFAALRSELRPSSRPLRLTDNRRRGLAARLRDIGGLDGWRTALEAVRRSPFLRGDTPRWGGAEIDWMLQPANLTKVMEGNYDDRSPGSGRSALAVSGSAIDTMRAARAAAGLG